MSHTELQEMYERSEVDEKQLRLEESEEGEGREESYVADSERKTESEGWEDSEPEDQEGKENEAEIEELVEEVKDEEVKDEEILQEVPENILKEEIICEGISLLRRTGNGLSYAFIQLELTDRDLTSIAILEKYIHLRIVDLSNNNLTNLAPLNFLQDLLYLKADTNRMYRISLDPLPYLQYVSLSNNRIENISQGLSHPLIRNIDLSDNKIKELPTFNESEFPYLTNLKLEGNKLQTIDCIDIPSLTTLSLGRNMITNLHWILNLVNLEFLEINNNFIEKLDGFHLNMKELKYIDLKGNMITDITELTKLTILPQLKSLSLADNPMCKEEDIRVEVLTILKSLVTLDDEEFLDEESAEAREITKQRLEGQNKENDEYSL